MENEIKLFENTLINKDFIDASVDFTQISIDALTGYLFPEIADFLRDIPVVQGIVAMGKLAWTISRGVSLRNQLAFIVSLKNETVDPQKAEKRRMALEKNEQWVKKEIETSIVFLDRYTDVKKAVYQSKMYRDLINERIKFDEYEEYLLITDRLFLNDLPFLIEAVDYYDENEKQFYDGDCINQIKSRSDKVRYSRLESLGLLEGLISSRVGTSVVDRYLPTDQGRYFYSIVTEDSIQKNN